MLSTDKSITPVKISLGITISRILADINKISTIMRGTENEYRSQSIGSENNGFNVKSTMHIIIIVTNNGPNDNGRLFKDFLKPVIKTIRRKIEGGDQNNNTLIRSEM